MAIERSPEMILVGYFLSRCSQKRTKGISLPPPRLQTDSWTHTYAVFFDALADGRSLRSFANSLKNSRDQFDSHLDSGRRGWRLPDGSPKPLIEKDARVFHRWSYKSDEELWEAVKPFADLGVSSVPSSILRDLESEPAESEEVIVGTEGKRKAVVSLRAERSPKLRAEAVRVHGTTCQVCGFDFGKVYGEWGEGFIEVHHLKLLSEVGEEGTDTHPESDMAVVCANCHRMLHRKAGMALDLEMLRAMLRVEPSSGS